MDPLAMEIINTHDAKTHLSRLLERVTQGEEFIIARAGKPVARLTPFKAEDPPRTGGLWKGLVRIDPDFDGELPDPVAESFGVDPR